MAKKTEPPKPKVNNLPPDAQAAAKKKCLALLKLAEGMSKSERVEIQMNKPQLTRYAKWLLETNAGQGKPSEYKPEYAIQLIKMFEEKCKEPYRIEEFIVYDRTGKALTTNDGEPLKDKRPVANNPPYLIDFAVQIGVVISTVMRWAKAHPEFGDAMMHAREMRTQFIVNNGLQNLYNPQSWIYATKNLSGWTDRADITSKDESIFNVKLQRFGNPDEAEDITAKTEPNNTPPMLS